ncbi:hypothetical protein SMICM304S_06811 [Streptomyces microflavus]
MSTSTEPSVSTRVPSMSRSDRRRAAPSAVRVKDAGTVLLIRHTFRKGREGRPPLADGEGDRPALDRPVYDLSGDGARTTRAAGFRADYRAMKYFASG